MKMPSALEGRLPLLMAAAITVAVMSTPALAITKKLLQKIGVPDIDPKISSLVTTLLKPADGAGVSDVNQMIAAGIALLMLLAFGALLYAVGSMMSGARGGGQKLFMVLGGLLATIACVQILG